MDNMLKGLRFQWSLGVDGFLMPTQMSWANICRVAIRLWSRPCERL